MKKHQSGFTLVEIAIVLVIIGLLLGGVLKGQEMIANGKYKSLRSDINSYGAAMYTFQDRFRASPGDMTSVNAQAQLNLAVGGGGNGLITNAVCAAAGDESCMGWQHLRAANLIAGSSATAGAVANPTHAYGGIVQGIVDATHGTRTGRWLILQNLPGDVGGRLDREVDDGTGNTGTVFCAAGCAGGVYPIAGNLVTVRVLL